MKILLLYDTNEKDLARDIKDFIEVLGPEVTMIPRSASLGGTLQEKEKSHFEQADGIVFLLTPGSVRAGTKMPSPSVADEMGQARSRFPDNPEKTIYLVDSECHPQAIDQKEYIRFVRSDARSVIEALTILLKSMIAAHFITPDSGDNEREGANEDYDETDCRSKIAAWIIERFGGLDLRALDFTEMDKTIGLPPGSSQKYFSEVAESCDYTILKRGTSTVLLKYQGV